MKQLTQMVYGPGHNFYTHATLWLFALMNTITEIQGFQVSKSKVQLRRVEHLAVLMYVSTALVS